MVRLVINLDEIVHIPFSALDSVRTYGIVIYSDKILLRAGQFFRCFKRL
jgi:hypothetical protein